MTTTQKSIHELIAHSKANANLAGTLYKVIIAAPKEEQVDLFKQAVLEFKYTPSDEEWDLQEVFTKSEEFEMFELAKRNLLNILTELRNHDYSEHEFHNKFWNMISDSDKFKDEKERYMLLFACAANKTLPYINKADVLTMTQDEFDASIKEMNPSILTQVKHIFNQDFEQVTEDASMFLPLLEQCNGNKKDQAIVLSIILMRFRDRIMTGLLRNPFEDDDE